MQTEKIWFVWAARRTHQPPKRQSNVSTSATLRSYRNRIILLNEPIITKIDSTWMRPNIGVSICWQVNWQRRTCHVRFIANWENVLHSSGRNVLNCMIQSKWIFAKSKHLITPFIPAAVVVIVSVFFFLQILERSLWHRKLFAVAQCYTIKDANVQILFAGNVRQKRLSIFAQEGHGEDEHLHWLS